MSYDDFLRRLAEYKKVASVEELVKMPAHRYAVTCRNRGKSYVARLRRLLVDDIRRIKLLDVGCAYGGITIELAMVGARAAGAEVVPSYIDLAKRNACGDVDVDFFHGDLTLKSTMERIRNGRISDFNVFVINHVLEHIYDTEGLLQNLDRVASDDALVLFDVPNGFSIISYLAEGHTGIFGVSLADPDCWHYFGNPRARIYYRRFEHYRALFAAHGYQIKLARPDMAPRESMIEKLKEVLAMSQEKAKSSLAPKHILGEAMARFESEVAYDLVHADDDELDLKYFNYFWRGVAYRDKDRLRSGLLDHIPFAAWGDD